jgi:hypothetical protein
MSTRARVIWVLVGVGLVVAMIVGGTQSGTNGPGNGSSSGGSSGSSGDIEDAATDIFMEVFGPCFASSGSATQIKDGLLVRLSTEVEGVVTVSLFGTNIATGQDVEYDFRINTGLGSYTGLPKPGTGIPLNDAASRRVATC